jgi:hypothetical protein
VSGMTVTKLGVLFFDIRQCRDLFLIPCKHHSFPFYPFIPTQVQSVASLAPVFFIPKCVESSKLRSDETEDHDGQKIMGECTMQEVVGLGCRTYTNG